VLKNKSILPGETGEISLEYDTKGIKGLATQSVDIRTNNPEKRWEKLTLTATVKMSTVVLPEKIWLDEISMGEVIKREIVVVDSGDKSLMIKKVDVPEGITAEIKPVKENSNAQYSIPVMLTINSGTQPGQFEKLVTIHTNDLKKDKITVPVSGIILSELKAFPPNIFFGEVKPNTTVVREITLSPTIEKKVEITGAISASPYISTEIKAIENNSKFKLITTFLAPESDTTIHNNIPVYVNGNDYPAIEIPLYAKVVINQ
jgi:hypothetical protein